MVRATVLPRELRLGTIVIDAGSYASWRDAARTLLYQRVEPRDVSWLDRSGSSQLLLGMDADTAVSVTNLQRQGFPSERASGPIRVPRRFTQLAEATSYHRDPERWELLYRILWRLTHGETELLEVITDDDVHAVLRMEQDVRRALEAMKAGIRFRRVGEEQAAHYLAWYAPEQRILGLIAPFLQRRFGVMTWSVVTPDASIHWDGEQLRYGEGSPVPPGMDAPTGSLFEAESKTTRRQQTANRPTADQQRARPLASDTACSRAEQKSLLTSAPSTAGPFLQASSQGSIRLESQSQHRPAQRRPLLTTSAEEFLPDDIGDLTALRKAAADCQGCDLYRHATQTVFGEGAKRARVVFVGEQPGDSEDRRGKPFVGPAGKLLDEVLEEVGIDRGQVYITNAVKHFKWTPRGKRRLHGKPNAREVAACRPWIEAELTAIRPEVLVCLGATAVSSLLGSGHRLTKEHGQVFASDWAPSTIITYHPSAILRAIATDRGDAMRKVFVNDMRQVVKALRRSRRSK